MLGKSQWLTIGVALLVGIGLYYGFSLKKPSLNNIEAKRLLNQVENSEPILIAQATDKLNPEQADVIHVLHGKVQEADTDTLKAHFMKSLSGKWYDYGFPTISSIYAQRIADIEKTAAAWSIAASTSYIAMQNANTEMERKYARASAISSYEKAITLAPDDISYKVNLALTYVKAPPEGKPMKGVLMLLNLDKKYPNDPLVMKSLAKLAIQTRQYQKAADRLVKLLEKYPEDIKAWCLLSEAYRNLSVSPNTLNEAIEHCRGTSI